MLESLNEIIFQKNKNCYVVCKFIKEVLLLVERNENLLKIEDHLFSTYAKFSEQLIFLTP